MLELNKESKREKFTTTLDGEVKKKLGVIAALLGVDKNDIIEIMVDEINTEEWVKNHEVEKTRRNIQ